MRINILKISCYSPWEAIQLLLHGRRDCRHKIDRIEIQIVAKDLRVHLGRDERLVLVPREGVAQLLPVDVHVQPDGDERLRAVCVVVLRAGVGVVEAQREGADLLVDHAVAVDGRGLGNGVLEK